MPGGKQVNPLPGFGLVGIPQDVHDTVLVKNFTLPGTHTVSIKAKNCNAGSPSTTLTFELRFQ